MKFLGTITCGITSVYSLQDRQQKNIMNRPMSHNFTNDISSLFHPKGGGRYAPTIQGEEIEYTHPSYYRISFESNKEVCVNVSPY